MGPKWELLVWKHTVPEQAVGHGMSTRPGSSPHPGHPGHHCPLWDRGHPASRACLFSLCLHSRRETGFSCCTSAPEITETVFRACCTKPVQFGLGEKQHPHPIGVSSGMVENYTPFHPAWASSAARLDPFTHPTASGHWDGSVGCICHAFACKTHQGFGGL